ncbi:MAG: anti-sigma factor [Crocinitomicaceae bacterium]
MDIEQYINSGIIESYVLGAASNQEQQEIACLSAIYPEINDAVKTAQESLEKYISTMAVQPPEALKAEILNSIATVKQVENNDESDLKISKKGEVKKMNFSAYGLVASVLIIAGLFYFLNTTTKKLNDSAQELSQSAEKLNALEEGLTTSSKQFRDSIQNLADKNKILLATETKLIALAGTEVSPNSKVRVFWNRGQSEIIVIQDFLPAPNEKQYQLWAISEGKPIDLGVLDKNGLTTEKRKIAIDDVDAFAVTLEIEGGAESPDLSQLYVIGNT